MNMLDLKVVYIVGNYAYLQMLRDYKILKNSCSARYSMIKKSFCVATAGNGAAFN